MSKLITSSTNNSNNIALDLGGSLLRVMNSSTVLEFEPAIKEIEDTEFNNFSDRTTDDFSVTISPQRQFMGKSYAKGESINAYEGRILSCDNQTFKSYQDATYINYMYCVARILLNKKKAEWADIKTGVCLPAKEFYSLEARDFLQKLIGTYEIHFPRLQRSVSWKVTEDNATITSEGGAVFTDLFKNRPELRKALKTNVLMIDVGFRSTEIMLYSGGKLNFQTVASETYGGATLSARLTSLLAKAGVINPDLEMAIQKGVIYRNDKRTSVFKVLNSVKQSLAEDLRNSTANCASITPSVGNISNINEVICVGRLFTPLFLEDSGLSSDLSSLVMSALGLDKKPLVTLYEGHANVQATYNLMSTKWK